MDDFLEELKNKVLPEPQYSSQGKFVRSLKLGIFCSTALIKPQSQVEGLNNVEMATNCTNSSVGILQSLSKGWRKLKKKSKVN